MSIFRIFQPHTQEYMFAWNSFVALHTFEQLSEQKREDIMRHYHCILALNQVDPYYDISMAVPDPFWLSFTLADLGIAPMLGPKTAKWFYVVDPRGARRLMLKNPQELGWKVIQDIQSKFNISLQLPG